jgi:hypothetical protein
MWAATAGRHDDKGRPPRFLFFFSLLTLTTAKPVHRPFIQLIPTPASNSIKMSDAPAAPVTEQGVPPATQTEEAPSFKVTHSPLFALQFLSLSLIRSSSEILRIPLRMKG